MTALDQIVRRLVAPARQHPRPPVQARWAFPTMLLAPDDEARPSPRLVEIALAAARAAAERVDLSDLAARPGAKNWFTIWPGEHYRLLAALVMVLQPKLAVEIGTAEGQSAVAIEKYLPAGGTIATFDLAPWNARADTFFLPEDLADGRIVQHLDDLSDDDAFERHRPMLQDAEFLFIDGPKDEVFEFAFMDKLRTVQFRKPPILLFDDIRLWSMLKFWRELPHPKFDLLSFGHSSGSGLVELC